MTSKDENSGSEFDFQAEVSRLLHLMVHSVYTEKEIFLRELISNASDACDRLRYLSVTQPELLGEDTEFKITIEIDKDGKTLSIADNGIGMDRQDLIDNLGTIARSGTKAFLDQIETQKSEKEGAALIGQFGVGFYSAFMVADRVVVVSRKAGSEKVNKWSSDGEGGFSVEAATEDDSKELTRGTRISLHLKEDCQAYLAAGEIERIVRTYSDHIPFPIVLTGQGEGEDEDKDKDKQLNSASALWSRPKSEIELNQYKEFYHHVSAQFDEPAITIHYKAEGRHEYSVLLFVPTHPPFDLFDPNRSGRIKLYVKRVFITDDADLLPPYLRFVRGVVDSQDMPLNISREMLQNNPIVAAIRKAVTNRVLSELKKCAENEGEKYQPIWEAFGPVIKEGLYEDPERRDAIYDIVRFKSTRDDNWHSLSDYVENMREAQKTIYYLAGESLEQLQASPQLEGFKARGAEVLLLTDPVDNFWVTTATGYDGKKFQSISQGQADLSDIPYLDESKQKEAEKGNAKTGTLLAALKTVLEDSVSDVQASGRLVDSAACLVAPAQGPDLGLEKILERQAQGLGLKPILEINLGHDLVKALVERAGNATSDEFKDLAWLLLDEARILDGGIPSDPAKFSERMNRFILAGL